ncbi:MAG: O-sialoglycoprotein endopeptidase [Bacillota bacterium]
MKDKGMVLGIDTSNYTTSIALVDLKGNILLDKRKILDVKIGERGLRQSDALFQHVNNMPILFNEIEKFTRDYQICTVSASSKPRPVENSYMPVFLAGQSFGQTIAKTLHCPYFACSHQENHIEAACSTIHESFETDFIAVHMSGGTTEILKIHKNENHAGPYAVEIIGGTSDLSAGQFIDRVGVALGFSFPAGKSMDNLALAANEDDLHITVSVQQGIISYSGPETMAQKFIQSNRNPNNIARAVLENIALSLEKAITFCCMQTGIKNVIFIGGVASSQFLNKYFTNRQNKYFTIYFAKRELCTDNAVGTALLGLRYYRSL